MHVHRRFRAGNQHRCIQVLANDTGACVVANGTDAKGLANDTGACVVANDVGTDACLMANNTDAEELENKSGAYVLAYDTDAKGLANDTGACVVANDTDTDACLMANNTDAEELANNTGAYALVNSTAQVCVRELASNINLPKAAHLGTCAHLQLPTNPYSHASHTPGRAQIINCTPWHVCTFGHLPTHTHTHPTYQGKH